jgi:UDP-N-acetylglucosamine 1-carboxyvinyltransferase
VSGTITPSGNKNAALPMLAAALLGEHAVRLRNVPAIRDVHDMIRLVRSLGAEVRELGDGAWEVDGSSVERHESDPEVAGEIRASFLLAGPLLARWGRAELPRPGGDRIGRRPLDTHIHAFLDFGASVEVEPDRYVMSAPRGLTGSDVFLHEMSVMGTENAVMAASLARGTSVIRNAASEPHVQSSATSSTPWAAVEGIGTNTLVVEGRQSSAGPRSRSGLDPVEVGSFIGLRGRDRRRARITGARLAQHHLMTRLAYGRLGIPGARRGTTSWSRRPRSWWSARTSTAPSRRSTTGRGRPSRPTSRASRSCWRPSRGGPS